MTGTATSSFRCSTAPIPCKAAAQGRDATYVRSEIPSRHVPGFRVEPGVTLVPPNGLVDLAGPADRFTVVGAGKAAP